MKRSILFVGLVLLFLNILLGLFISKYLIFNVVLNSVVIIITALLVYIAARIEIKDAFKTSFATLFPLIGLVEFLLGLFSKGVFIDNWVFLVDIILIVLEALSIYIAYIVSKTNNK